MKQTNWIQEDVALVQAMQLKATGATVHKINNLLGAYRGFIQCYNELGLHFDKIGELEREIRTFLYQQQKALTCFAPSIY